jgi:hypothetical protein
MNSGGEERLFSLVHQAWRMPARGFIPGLLDTPPSGQVWRSYYYAGSQRVAMREQRSGSNDEVYLLLGDNLGSTSISYHMGYPTDTVTERYKAWGEFRDGINDLPTDYTFTG